MEIVGYEVDETGSSLTLGNEQFTECLSSGCDIIKAIFDMVGCPDAEVIKRYGEVADFPYDI